MTALRHAPHPVHHLGTGQSTVQTTTGKNPGGRRPPGRALPQAPTEPKETLGRAPVEYAIKETDVPPHWANLVHPLYKKGDWANPDNRRHIVCATTKAKLIWMLILKRLAMAVYCAVPPTMWGAIPG